MAKAHRAPMDTYEPHLAVSEHAVQRFRERARDFLDQGGHLSDAAVGHQVDFAVWDAMQADDRTFEILDSGQPSKLIHIENEAWGSLWALVRENRNARFSQRWAVITILTDWQMTQNALDGRYQGNVPRLPQFVKHFEAAAKPKLVKAPEVIASAVIPPPAPPPDAAKPPPAEVTVAMPDCKPNEVRHADERLLVYRDADGNQKLEVMDRTAASERITSLCAAGIVLRDIKVWRPASVRIEVD